MSKEESYRAEKEDYVVLTAEQAASIMAWDATQQHLNTPAGERFRDGTESDTAEELFHKIYQSNLDNISKLNQAPDDFINKLGK